MELVRKKCEGQRPLTILTFYQQYSKSGVTYREISKEEYYEGLK